MIRSRLILAALAACAVSCGSKGTVSLSANLQNPQVSVEQAALGAKLGGSFELFLEVGPEAESGSTVSLESFALVRASDQSTLLAPLPAMPDGTTFPLDVPKGGQRVVPFLVGDDDLLDASTKDAICAEPVQIVGAVRDTLSGGGVTSVRSTGITVSGC